MLLILMYHRVHDRGLSEDALRCHLGYIRDHHPVVLPGDSLPKGELSVCLTFDDATVDFYHEVYPLLQELDCRALVALPTAYIDETTALPMDVRLNAQQKNVMKNRYRTDGCPLCTWKELREMQESGRVLTASHGHSHRSMIDAETDVEAELTKSYEAIEHHLGDKPSSFVFPFGTSNDTVRARALERYSYAMRIGTAMNVSWDDNGGFLYRVDAESFWPQGKVWSLTQSIMYRVKYLSKRIRGK
jgi:peptidoglycan/xylan/chitin deacetylase (PgdA/CDA1 family)